MVRIINTKTKKDFINAMAYVIERGYFWNAPSGLSEVWDEMKEKTCIFLTKNRCAMFNEESFYRENYPNINIETWKIAPWPMEPSEIEKQADNLGVNTYDEALEKHIKLRTDIFKFVHNLRLKKRWNNILDQTDMPNLGQIISNLEIILKENE